MKFLGIQEMTFIIIFTVIWIGIVVFAVKHNGKKGAEFDDTSMTSHSNDPNQLGEAEKNILDNCAHGHPEFGSIPFGWSIGLNKKDIE